MNPTLSDIIEDFRGEFALTHKVIAACQGDVQSQPISPGGKSVGELIRHLTDAHRRISQAAGITLGDFSGDLVAAYRDSSEALLAALDKQRQLETPSDCRAGEGSWLREEVTIYGLSWSRQRVFSVLLRHEIHHRGQLSLLLRQLGARVPAVYGPSADEQ